jgi:uncharacterized phiE125 gp8 family phage protein
MNYDTTIVTAPNGLPLHADHVKKQLSIWDTDRDLLVPGWIRSAWEEVEGTTARRLLHTRYALTMRAFPCKSMRIGNEWAYLGIVLPHVPVVSVVSIQYVDTAGVTQTLSTSNYTLNRSAEPSFIVPAYATSWPSVRDQEQAITVTYDAGYASPVTADATANTLTSAGPVTWAVADPVRLWNSGGALPTPLVADTTYYIKTAVAGVYTIAATASGSAIDLTDVGTGTHFIGAMPDRMIQWMLLKCGEANENRERSVLVPAGQVSTLEFADHLLDKLRVYLP